MGDAGRATTAAAWPATAATRRAQARRTTALLAGGGSALLLGVAALAVAVARAGGDLDQPAGPETVVVLLGVSVGLPLLGFGVVGWWRSRRVARVLDRAPWVVAASSAVTVHGGTVRQRPTVLATVVPSAGEGVTVLAVVDSAAAVARLVEAGDGPLWLARVGADWVVSPPGGASPVHAKRGQTPLGRADERGLTPLGRRTKGV